MPSLDLVDHSPRHPLPAAALPNAARLILIDNYDSFTWNVYQYLVLEGATVSVYRNDQITLEELIAKDPTQLVISPGPGHPDHDSGISRDAIEHFAGKIPILGVCMGEQCIVSVFGGKVEYAGEILHGKTSELRHDSKGVYKGVPQNIPVTRYHSLAGTHLSLPECLEVSSWTERVADGSTPKVIMGVRHKTLLVEGVQFHPESILTAEGRTMLKNFLKMKGGTWAENEQFIEPIPRSIYSEPLTNGHEKLVTSKAQLGNDRQSSILEKIYDHRKATVRSQMQIPGQRLSDLQAIYDMDIFPPQVSFLDRLKDSPYPLSLMAEIKRASPSKGDISLETCAPAQARVYASAGASVISVLTEPEWFKGGIDDLRAVRQALEGFLNRPAILRKDFVFEEYQILEARLAGADTVLLIVKMLEEKELTRLYNYSLSLKMEPLVEVNSAAEMKRAVKLGAKIIGVNNRNLTSFEVDLETTSRLMDLVPEDAIVCALSGISTSSDIEQYKKQGVKGFLIGEALMRASQPEWFIKNLFGDSDDTKENDKEPRQLMVKICGTRTLDGAKAAIEAGADFIGIILVEGRSRYVDTEQAMKISQAVHESRKPDSPTHTKQSLENLTSAKDFFEHNAATLPNPSRLLLVGVFQNQPLSLILSQQRLLNLDVVQLHGSEPLEWASLIPVPVIRSFKPGAPGIGRRGYHALPLLDSASGGEGRRLDMAAVTSTLEKDSGLRVILAGGLNAMNVKEAVEGAGKVGDRIVGVDVSSGVEEDGVQSPEKIKKFVRAVKEIR
ncbi:MAG: bifunctional tryptophan synthase trp1 [Peltula sp. TS41687]|nr:MAG: bifunctional tryptophan synthase trp1 [Peltula sp. TS41687]